MIIICPKCQTRYQIDARDLEGGRDVQCCECQNTWYVEPEASKNTDKEDASDNAPDNAIEVNNQKADDTVKDDSDASKSKEDMIASTLGASVMSSAASMIQKEAQKHKEETQDQDRNINHDHGDKGQKVEPSSEKEDDDSDQSEKTVKMPSMRYEPTSKEGHDVESKTVKHENPSTAEPRKKGGIKQLIGLILMVCGLGVSGHIVRDTLIHYVPALEPVYAKIGIDVTQYPKLLHIKKDIVDGQLVINANVKNHHNKVVQLSAPKLLIKQASDSDYQQKSWFVAPIDLQPGEIKTIEQTIDIAPETQIDDIAIKAYYNHTLNSWIDTIKGWF